MADTALITGAFSRQTLLLTARDKDRLARDPSNAPGAKLGPNLSRQHAADRHRLVSA